MYLVIAFIWYSGKDKSAGTENRSGGDRAGGMAGAGVDVGGIDHKEARKNFPR